MPVSSTCIISLQNVTYHYSNRNKILDGSAFSIYSGEFVAILGQKKSGKSTLARLLNALLLPTSGVVLINGMDTRDLSMLWEIRRQVGMILPEPDNQIVGTTVAEDVAFGPENLGWSSEIIQARVLEALQIVGMLSYADSAPHILSRLQKLKVSLAGVLAMQPVCLVLDGSCGALDAADREELQQLLLRLNREHGLTVLVMAELLEEIGAADRVFELQAGRLVRNDTVLPGRPSC